MAVILVGLYAIAFGAALWVLRAQALHGRRPGRQLGAPAGAPAGVPMMPDRNRLLSVAGLAPDVREEYARSLAADCCDCGCDRTLHECLVGEEKCVRSAQMAKERLERLR